MQNDPSKRKFIKTLALGAAVIPLQGLALPKDEEQNEVMTGLKPLRLKRGDTVAISSPAGAIWDDKLVPEFTAILEGLGLKVILGKTLSQKYGFLAGDDALRAKELNDFFADKTIKAIFTAKGGWGCARLLDKIDFEIIKANPKIIMGFSDITCLLNAIYAKTGLITFHGPVGNSSWGDFSMKYVKQVLFEGKRSLLSTTGYAQDTPVTLTGGKAKGVLVGGNMSVLTAMLGSNYLPSWKGKILFLEETAEEPYRLDRMITHLKIAGVLDQLAGFVWGKCVKCEAEEPEKAFTFMQILDQQIKPLNIPAFYGAMIGHIENKYTLPIGVEVEMDADKGTIQLLEPAVV
ncbi:MAG TPA: LD-carboxypeptidase [Flavobacteriales bacterium]|nr:LD-carboxypeptidase [Flavobacteriales bacterium]